MENTRLHGEKLETTEQIVAGREEKSIVQKGLFLGCSIRVFMIQEQFGLILSMHAIVF